MHELSIAAALIDQTTAIARREGAHRIVRIVIEVGAVSGVDAEALRTVFPIAAANSPAADAALDIVPVPLRVHCNGCGIDSDLVEPYPCCPRCDSVDVRIDAGRELIIKSLELEDPSS